MRLPTVLFAGPEFPTSRDLLRREVPDLAITLRDSTAASCSAEVLIPLMTKIDGHVMDSVSGLRLIQQWGAGLEGVDIDATTARNIAVGNVSSSDSGNAGSVAEWCVMAMLALGRHLRDLDGVFAGGQVWGAPLGISLAGSTIGIVGLGGIGTALARRLVGFDVRTVAVTRRPDSSRDSELGLAWQGGADCLPRLLEESKFVCLCVPLTPTTRHLIDRAALARMRPGAFLVNAGRGGLVEEEALVASLERDHLGGAALDVFATEPLPADSPLLALSNVLATPHIAGVTDRSYIGIARQVAAILGVLAERAPLSHCVNWSAIAAKFYDVR